MDQLDIARWQFGITTVYHFIFVPITIGLSVLVAILETAYVRTGKEHYRRATKFWGKLFLINFALGVATGIVQEFQFGMAWSDYSRYVGDIFGAPLAIEGLLAFFLESTFLGLWIFGWDKLPKAVHAACLWAAAIGTVLSAYFILAANSWMQHPVGYRINAETGRAELTDFPAVLTNSTTLVTFPHVLFAAFMTGAAVMIGVAAWHLARGLMIGLGLLAALVAGVLLALIGPAGRRLRLRTVRLARARTASSESDEAAVGADPADVAKAGADSAPADGIPRWVWRVAVWAIPLPLLANSFGWIFTEMGRQPWVVYGALRTADGVSPSVSGTTIAFSLAVFTLLYGVLAVVEFGLMAKYATAGPQAPATEIPDDDDAERPLAFAY